MSGNCPENSNLFCYVCGKTAFSTNAALLTELVERAFKLYFDCKIIRGVSWVPDKICKTCYNGLNMWIQGKRSSLRFGVPMIWTDPGEHNSDNCYACANKICGVNRKGLKRRVYISVKSAQISLPHSDEIPIPPLPSPDRETSCSIKTMDQSDFTYKPTPEEEEEYTMEVSSEDEYRSSSDTGSEQVGEPPRKKVKCANKRK